MAESSAAVRPPGPSLASGPQIQRPLRAFGTVSPAHRGPQAPLTRPRPWLRELDRARFAVAGMAWGLGGQLPLATMRGGEPHTRYSHRYGDVRDERVSSQCMHFDELIGVSEMPSLQIRDLPDDLYQALAFRARQEHRSLAQQAVVELRRIPALTAGERRRAVIARIRASLQEPEAPLTPSPEELVREDRGR